MDELPEGFDLDALLAPIAEDAAAGTDLREDASPQSLYYRLRDARAEARAAERAMESDDEAASVPPQWRTIRQLGIEAIAQNSKDLEVASWLTEALLRCDGLAGFIAGVRLMHGLVDTFWDDLFPLPDADGIATRVGPLAGLNGISGDGTLSQPLRRLPLFLRTDGAEMELWQFQQSAELAAIVDPERRQQRIAAGVTPFDTAEAEARAAGAAHFTALHEQAKTAAEAWRSLGTALDARAGADAPPTSRVQELLEQLAGIAARYGAPEGAPVPEASAAEFERHNEHAGRCAGRVHGICDHCFARGRASQARRHRRFFPSHGAPVAALLHAAGSRAARPHELARTARGDRARRRLALGDLIEPRHPPRPRTSKGSSSTRGFDIRFGS